VFDGTYLVHFGDDIGSSEYDRAVDGLAEYLYLGTVSRCAAFFDICRDTEEFEAGVLKTMGISSIGQGHLDVTDDPSERLIQKLLGSWLDSDDQADTARRLETCAESIVEQTGLTGEPVESRIRQLIAERLGDDALAELLREVRKSLPQPPPEDPDRLASLVGDQLLARLGEPRPDGPADATVPAKRGNFRVCEFVESRIPPMARQLKQEVAEAVLALIDQPEFRVVGTRGVADAIVARLLASEQEMQQRRDQQLAAFESARQRCREQLESRDCQQTPTALAKAMLEEMVSHRLEYVVAAANRKLLRVTRNELAATVNRLDGFFQQLDLLRNQLRLPMEVHDIYTHQEDKPSSLYRLLVDYATDRAVKKVSDLDRRLEDKVLRPEGGLRTILSEGGHRLRQLPGSIKREAQVLVSDDLQELRLDSMIVDSQISADLLAAWISDLVRPVTPLLFKCGGTARLLMAVPQKAPIATLATYIQTQLDYEANIIPSTSGDFVICLEMDQMPSENVAMTLLQIQPDCAELIERLHSRTDVDWSSLTPLC
jgi:hypothetical protein